MSLTLFVNGVDRTAQWFYPSMSRGDGGTWSRRAGSQSPGSFVLYDTVAAAGYRPTTGQDLQVKDGGVAVFGSTIVDVEEETIGEGFDIGVKTHVTAVDYMALPKRAYYTKTYAAGAWTLKQILQDLVANPLAVFGITLDPAQAVGAASFTALTYTNATAEAILNQLQTLTGWPWRITPGKVLRMIAPATESCGFALSDSSTTVLGLPTAAKQRSTSYANKIVATFGPSGVYASPRTETITANGVAASWVLDVAAGTPYTDAGGGGTITVGGVIKNSAVGEFTWTTDPTTATATLTLPAAPAAATIITFKRNIDSPFVVIRQDAALVAGEGPWPALYTVEDVTDVDTAVTYAAALLARDKAEPWIITVSTDAGLPWPGQTIALNFADRVVNATYMVLTVDIATNEAGALEATLVCVAGSTLQADWLAYFKNLGGGGGTGSIAVSAGVTSVTVTSLSSPVFLGGSRSTFVAKNPAAWSTVPNYTLFTAPGDFTGRLRVDVAPRVGGDSVQARLFDVTAGAAVAGMTTSAVTAATSQVVTGSILAGHTYRLEVLNGAAGAGVTAIGSLEAV